MFGNWISNHRSCCLMDIIVMNVRCICNSYLFIYPISLHSILNIIDYLTHPVNFPCGRKPEYPEKTHDLPQSVDLCSHEDWFVSKMVQISVHNTKVLSILSNHECTFLAELCFVLYHILSYTYFTV